MSTPLSDLVAPHLNIANGIRESAVGSPSGVASVDDERRATFAELHERSSRVAQVLLASRGTVALSHRACVRSVTQRQNFV